MAFNETMNDTNNNMNVLSDDNLDALSFCDLPIYESMTELESGSTSCGNNDDDDNGLQQQQEVFEFSTSPEHYPEDSIIFFGKSIVTPAKQQPGCLVVRKDSLKKSHSSRASDASSSDYSGSTSFRFGGPKAVSGSSGGSLEYYRSSSGSRPSKMILGLVMKVEPTMELSDMRKRQGRRTPAPMFPPKSTRRAAGRNGKSGQGQQQRYRWGKLRPDKCRAHIASALSKASFGCLSYA